MGGKPSSGTEKSRALARDDEESDSDRLRDLDEFVNPAASSVVREPLRQVGRSLRLTVNREG